MTKLRPLTGLIVAACLVWTTPARADVVTDWNAVIVQYVSIGNPGATPSVPPGRGGPPGLLDIALVHLAMHDAVQAIEGNFRPYHYSDPSKRGIGRAEAAAAAAAHRTLVLLYPVHTGALDTFYNNYLTTNGLAGDPGLAVGEAAAISLHTNHYRAPVTLPPFFGAVETGKWRSTTSMTFLELTATEPFALKRSSQFRPPPPPPLRSFKYFREYEEVRKRGNAAAHPNAESDDGRFWSVNFIAQWNETLRHIADGHLTDINDSARLFALVNTAAADAAIAVWDSKLFYNFWRPSTAIQEGDSDRNPFTRGDVTWAPFLANPNYPDYVSGANGLTGAITGMLRLFFRTDKMDFSVKTTHPLVANPERFYERFSEAAEEVVDARIILGIHFRSADEEARRLGQRIALWTIIKELGPTRHHHKGH